MRRLHTFEPHVYSTYMSFVDLLTGQQTSFISRGIKIVLKYDTLAIGTAYSTEHWPDTLNTGEPVVSTFTDILVVITCKSINKSDL